MRIGKAKIQKSHKASMRTRAEVYSMAKVSREQEAAVPASVVAHQFCGQLIQNLRHNVAESKKRARQVVAVV